MASRTFASFALTALLVFAFAMPASARDLRPWHRHKGHERVSSYEPRAFDGGDGYADFSDPAQYKAAQEYMLSLINDARGKARLAPVQLDAPASDVGRQHASDMLTGDYFSHWDMSGNKPLRRWNLAGGFDALQENVYYHYGTWGSAKALIDEAMDTLLHSPGHRAAILAPEHNFVGIGFAGDPQARRFEVDQEFLTRAGGEYACPQTGAPGATVTFTGHFDAQRYGFEHVIVGWEAPAVSRDRKWLNGTSEYRDGDKMVAGYCCQPDLRFDGMPTYNDVRAGDDGSFSCHARLDYRGKPGLYYLFLWLRDRQTGAQFQAAVATVDAR